MTGELLTIDKVAKSLGVARSTVYSWVKKGIFPEAGKLGPNSTLLLKAQGLFDLGGGSFSPGRL